MPARRSRTIQWRRCLEEIHQRGGSIEIAVARLYDDTENGHHLLWRVRVLDLGPDALVVEHPVALGRPVPIDDDAELVGMISIGQNRWMFRTVNRGVKEVAGPGGRPTRGLRLSLPQRVERCTRRFHYRVETASLSLPQVEMWPLLDPKSVTVAERANELRHRQATGDLDPADAAELGRLSFEDVMPEVGPRFAATLLNLGGGGVGVRVDPDAAQTLTRHKLFWMRLALPPELETPICATGKLIHTHMDSSQCTYGGLSFDFSFNPGHQQFVVDQICRFLSAQQREQRKAG